LLKTVSGKARLRPRTVVDISSGASITHPGRDAAKNPVGAEDEALFIMTTL
jgi:hypothetical protein